MHPVVDVIIPAINEEQSISLVISAIPADLIRNIYVCDNGSSDRTREVAIQAGATVINVPQRGYGSACMGGIQHILTISPNLYPEIVCFIDGDNSDFPEEMPLLLNKLIVEDLDLVIGSRISGQHQPGSLNTIQKFGNTLSCFLIQFLFNYNYTDLGPFRVIRFDKLLELDMKDPDYGWTVEMQVKAAKHKMKFGEVPVSYRKRIGKSKISGTIRGILGASSKIMLTIFKTYVKG